ncbi:Nucleic acid-binding, OB-fold containing protein [Trema orientale]|uniref:Nucleic acid-binding, OB-fold containing protein n=1 Tax=Trema orientale TaxID=63057 RepID=A0A2P5DB41_TREOI|nr:Nucleic acid-binding, OB-fold containing protein [Trema orientale]
MSKEYRLLKEITPATRSWTAKVLVDDKTMPRSSPSNAKKYQRLILIDPAGTRIQASIYEPDIEKFENKLTVNRSYYVSNAWVRPIPPRYRLVDNEYQWYINKSTLIQPVIEEAENISIPTLSLTKLSDLHKQLGSPQHVGKTSNYILFDYRKKNAENN